MAVAGKKRASPGAEEEKNPFDIEISDEVFEKLKGASADIARAELALERQAQKKLVGVYEKRRAVIKTVPKFWPIALMRNATIAMQSVHPEDLKALQYLEDVWVERESTEPRAFTLEFYFSENPYFSDKVIKKQYKYIAPSASKEDKPDEDGITQSMVEFDWERDVAAQLTKISWKDDSKNLVKLYPRVIEDDDVSDPGSFFNLFEEAKDPFDVGIVIANEVFPEAIDYFTGNAGDMDLGDTDEEDSDSDEDSDEAEIDLEKPKAKKQKKA